MPKKALVGGRSLVDVEAPFFLACLGSLWVGEYVFTMAESINSGFEPLWIFGWIGSGASSIGRTKSYSGYSLFAEGSVQQPMNPWCFRPRARGPGP